MGSSATFAAFQPARAVGGSTRVSPAAVLAVSHHFGRAGSHSSAKGTREDPAQGREGDGVLGRQKRMCKEQLSGPKQCPAGDVGHAQSAFAQPLPKVGPGTSLCSPGSC